MDSTSQQLQCHLIVPATAPGVCGVAFVRTECAHTCCRLDYTPPPASGMTVTGPTRLDKGSFAAGMLDVSVRFYSAESGRVDLVPYLVDDTGGTVSAVLWGAKTMSQNELTNLAAPSEARDAATAQVTVYLLSGTQDGHYNLRFAMKPAGLPWADRLQDATSDTHSFEVVNSYAYFSGPAPDIQLAQSTGRIINVDVRYRSPAPVRFAASLFCDPDLCGAELSRRSQYVLSNGRVANLAPASPTEGTQRLSVSIGPAIFTTATLGWTRYRLVITMGTYDPTDTGTRWVKTIGLTSDGTITVEPSPAAATGDHVAAAVDPPAAKTTSTEDDPAASGFESWIGALAAVLMASVAAAVLAVQRRRRAQHARSSAVELISPPVA